MLNKKGVKYICYIVLAYLELISPRSQICTLNITSVPGTKISVALKFSDVENYGNCGRDSLQVLDRKYIHMYN